MIKISEKLLYEQEVLFNFQGIFTIIKLAYLFGHTICSFTDLPRDIYYAKWGWVLGKNEKLRLRRETTKG